MSGVIGVIAFFIFFFIFLPVSPFYFSLDTVKSLILLLIVVLMCYFLFLFIGAYILTYNVSA